MFAWDGFEILKHVAAEADETDRNSNPNAKATARMMRLP